MRKNRKIFRVKNQEKKSVIYRKNHAHSELHIHEKNWIRRSLKLKNTPCLGMSYYVNFLGGLGSNEFHIK